MLHFFFLKASLLWIDRWSWECASFISANCLKLDRSMTMCAGDDCRQHYDGHELMIFNVGNGEFIEYILFNKYLLNMVNNGKPLKSFHKTLRIECKTLNMPFVLKWSILIWPRGYASFPQELCKNVPIVGFMQTSSKSETKNPINFLKTQFRWYQITKITSPLLYWICTDIDISYYIT